MPSKSTLTAFRRKVVAWFRKHGRDLPWRQTRDPYRIIVSEFMLQQTQVSRVEGFYHRFLERYPDLGALAEASPAMVRESWEGLGYYRRAANLHALARTVATDHEGVIPTEVGDLRALPGVGRYTAGAVATFAYEAAEPAVDTNVARVLTRAFHPRAGPGARDQERLWTTAKALVPKAGPNAWAFNQGLMELGALICTARQARCDQCPVAAACHTGRIALKGGRGRRRSTRPSRTGR